MSFEIIWVVLVSVLWIGFLFLEGFDFGVGILQFVLSKTERERGVYIYTIGPHWDGNEVWLLTAVGAILAAFPNWYATLFSAFYILFAFLLLALIVRGASFEIRHRVTFHRPRYMCDIALVCSSTVAAFLVGVIMANLVTGIPIDSNGNFTGTFFDLVKPPALLCGVLTLSLFVTNGALFLTLKLEGELQERACRISRITTATSAALFIAMIALVWEHSILCMVSVVFIVAAELFIFIRYFKAAFVLIGVCTAYSVSVLFYSMFPNVLFAANKENNLTIWNCASSEYTLQVMSVVALIFVPVILVYQSWSFYIFRKRISSRNVAEV